MQNEERPLPLGPGEAHDDYRPAPPSEREVIAETVAAFVRDNKLCEVYGGQQRKEASGKYRHVEFSLKRLLDGRVYVFSPSYVSVSFRGSLPGTPPEDYRIYASAEEAIAFLKFCFVDRDPDTAYAVPLRESAAARKLRVAAESAPAVPPKSAAANGAPADFTDFFGAAPPAAADDTDPLNADLGGLFGEDEECDQ